MGVETMIGLSAVSAGMGVLRTAGSAGSALGSNKTQRKIAEYNASVQRQDLYAERKDFKREAASFMSRMRNFVGTSGAAGTASGTALEQASAGEVGRALGRFDVKEDRINKNEQVELASLAASRSAIKQKASNMQLDNLLGFAGSAVGILGYGIASDKSAVTDLSSTGGKSLVGGRTSKPGGIGGF